MGSSMAPKHQRETILVIGPGPRRAAGTDQYAHGVVVACTALAEAGHKVVLIDNAPYLALPETGPEIERHVEPLTPEVVKQIAAHSGACLVYAETGGDGAQRLARTIQDLTPMGSGPEITALALDRSRLFSRLSELGLPVPAHAIVDTAQAALEVAQSMEYPLQATLKSDGDPGDAEASALLYNQSDLKEWVEQQLDIDPGAALLLEKAHLGWQRFEVIVIRDGEGRQAVAGLQAYLEPTGTDTADTGWVQPPVSPDPKLTQALIETSRTLLDGSDLKGVASLTLAVDPDTHSGLVLDLSIGTSRTIAFAAVAAGRPLFEMAARIALGAPLAYVWPQEQSTVAVRVPVSPAVDTGASDP